MNIAYTCKICKQPHLAECPDGTKNEWIAMLGPLLTCDPCSDLRDKFNRAQNRICKACWAIARAEQIGKDDAEIGMIRDRCRRVLMVATRAYAEAVAVYRKLDVIVWNADFVDILVNRPENPLAILRDYRAGLRGRPAARETSQPYKD